MARMEMTGVGGSTVNPAECSAEAYYRLGLMYSAGRDCPVDYVTAHKWCNIALVRGYRDAAALRSELAAQMSEDELAKALREARMFLTMH